MSYLRNILNLFLLLTVLALTIPSGISQDNTKSDDTSSQSDRSDDQPIDQLTLSDIIFEHSSILHKKFPREIYLKIISEAPKNHFLPQISTKPSFLPHLFNSGGGLMPRAPARA